MASRIRYINAADVPAEYGLTKAAVRTLSDKHKVPFHRPMRGMVLFDRRELEEWIQEGRIEPLEINPDLSIRRPKRRK